MSALLADLRYTLRRLRQSPGFTLTAVLTLALGIGATTAIFTLVYQVMLRPLPAAHPEQLFKVGKELDCCNDGGRLLNDWPLFSYSLYEYLRDHTPDTSGIAAVEAGGTTVNVRRAAGSTAAQPLDARSVSGNYFTLLGVRPYAGRLLSPEDDREGAPPALVLSYTLWHTKFNADPHLVGSTLLLTGRPFTVVGIAAPSFLGERNSVDPVGIWVPLAQEPVLEPEHPFVRQPGSHSLDLLTRIADPRRVPAVEQAVVGELRQWLAVHREIVPGGFTDAEIARQTTELAPAPTGINDLDNDYGGSLKLLQLVAAFVLLIACANLANLLLVRGMARKQELAVRVALGAPRLRLLRQTLMEAVLLSLAGSAAALFVAYQGSRAILALAFRDAQVIPVDPSPSLPVLGFALAAALITGLLFGFAPAWLGARADPVEALRGSNRSTRESGTRPQKTLVILQAAVSLAMLSTAGLLIESLLHLEHQNFRFASDSRLLVSLDLPGAGYRYEQLAGFYRRLDEAVTRLPGVQDFAYATYAPMAGNNWSGKVVIPGTSNQTGKASYAAVSVDYFRGVGTRILAGRAIGTQDTAASAHIAVINRAFADQLFPGRQPLGEHFGPDAQHAAEFTVVGVAEDTKYRHPSEPVPPMYFTPITQATAYSDPEEQADEQYKHYAGHFILHYRGEPATAAAQFRMALTSVDPDLPILGLRSYADQLGSDFTREQLVVRLTSLFGLLALGLAALGLYGVTAYGVARRTPEIGLRMALGASRGGVVALVLRGALQQAGAGLALGLPLAYAAARLLAHTFYQTSSFQPLILFGAASCLLLASVVAALLPARRAASIDPVIALRSE